MDFTLIDCNSTTNNNSYYPIRFNNNGIKRTENPCVGGSIPPLATTLSKDLQLIISFVINKYIIGPNSISNTKKQIASCARACSVRELHHMHSTHTNPSQSDTLQVKSPSLL